jgi:hypothetical protein
MKIKVPPHSGAAAARGRPSAVPFVEHIITLADQSRTAVGHGSLERQTRRAAMHERNEAPTTLDVGAAIPEPSAPRAYSYIRFSTPEQAKGHSLQRQTEAARAWAVANDVTLDDELTFRDRGVSGFTGANLETGALGVFLERVRDGTISRGSWLLVENLDRISRQSSLSAAAHGSGTVASEPFGIDRRDPNTLAPNRWNARATPLRPSRTSTSS